MSMIFQTRMNSPSLWSHKTSSFSLNLSGFLGCRSLQVLLEVHLSGSVGFRPKLKISPTGEFSLDPHAPSLWTIRSLTTSQIPSVPSDGNLFPLLRSPRFRQMSITPSFPDPPGPLRFRSLLETSVLSISPALSHVSRPPIQFRQGGRVSTQIPPHACAL